MENVYEFTDRTAIEQEAREWLIRLDSERPLTAAEAQALRAWIERSPAHEQELKRISTFWSQANVLTELAIPLEHARGSGWTGWFGLPRPSRIPVRPFGVAAAVLLLGVSVVLGTWVLRGPDRMAHGIYATAVGEQETVVLADGSTVRLNTDSQVEVDYGPTLRKLYLLRGEALFSVAPDSDRPFEVHAGDAAVRAVGTAFSVYLKDRDVRVTVTEGLVDLVAVTPRPKAADTGVATERASAEKRSTLRSGQSATFSSALEEIEITDLGVHELQRQLAWRDGYLVFEGESLSEVVAELNRYTPVVIEIAGPAVGSLAIGGRFKVGDLEAIFDVLESGFGVRIVRIGDRYVQIQTPRGP